MNIEELKKPLDRKRVESRSQGYGQVSYIQGWWAISEANRIFGFDSWTRKTVYCKEVCRYEVEVGKQKLPGWKVGYEAKVIISVDQDNSGQLETVIREGTGHGSSIAKDLFDCIEGAAKEAETDAMKRALMTFGNPFGLALYDKTQANVADIPEYISDKQIAELEALIDLSQADEKAFLGYFNVKELKMLPANQCNKAMAGLKKKMKPTEEKQNG